MGAALKRTKFHLLLIKPTHYDDDGYPITWLRSHIPSNTLAALHGLGEDCQARQVLGPDVDIVIRPIDETNTRVLPERLMAEIERSGGKGLICLVGVQTNQFPHAVNLARQFLKGRFPVAIGGFHVSGCLSMLPVTPVLAQNSKKQRKHSVSRATAIPSPACSRFCPPSAPCSRSGFVVTSPWSSNSSPCDTS